MFEGKEVFNSEIAWVRFEKYEICKNSSDQECIIPVVGSKKFTYYPFSHSLPSIILKDFLSIEMVIPENYRYSDNPLYHYEVWTEDVKTSVNNAIIVFTQKYGLLGLFLNDYESRLQKIDDYIEDYFPREFYLTYFERYPHSFQNPDKYDEYRLRPKKDSKSFWFGYAEPIVSILTHLKLISNQIHLWNDFIRSKDLPSSYMPSSDKTWEEKLSQFSVLPIRLSMSFYDVWQYKWDYNSLIDALRIMVINNCINKENQLKICEDPRCKIPFIASNPKKTFHSVQCAGKYRQDKLRGKI